MAKKVDVSKLSLQGKKPLAKPAASAEELETAVKEIHKEEETEKVEEPKSKKRPRSKKPEPRKRITFDLPASLHKRIKLHCVKEGVPLKDFLMECVVKEISKA